MDFLKFQELDTNVYAGNIHDMIDLARVEGFDWDDGNDRKSAEKHGVSRAEAEQTFMNEPLIAEGDRHSSGEPRFHALGRTDSGRRLHVTFTLRRGDALVRVISARDMNTKERAFYEQESGAQD